MTSSEAACGEVIAVDLQSHKLQTALSPEVGRVVLLAQVGPGEMRLGGFGKAEAGSDSDNRAFCMFSIALASGVT
jgi:hypothetical protein